ncbi:SRPBCC family protein [Streptomyces aurantiacus]|uniref:Putative Granaticin polyketide synthase bifunctional cyclase n=1 Tax=Streptomyces aurantiacus JA 4570 TaxID=1286094 RepID=S3Z972_9ACTN|nr:SRPBCC family protein [Streptomyces aurantiacus]EPH39673.1 putative Granaticin polyketide synthase bifunctional cyclase [Streptomyces aurantiacus JA 4570]
MSGERVRRLSHAVEVAAPAGVVYQLIADAERWPLYFPPNVHVERLDFDGVRERLRMWVLADGQVRSWTSQRIQDAARRQVTFRQDQVMEQAQSMGGTWTVTALGPERCRLSVEHEFTAAGDRPQDVAWLRAATTANARSDLRSLRFLAQHWGRLDELVLSFEESVRVKGGAELVYGFLYDVADWPQQVPHVRRVQLAEPQVGVQQVTLDLASADGTGAHTVTSVRVCFPHAGRIVHKETATRKLIAAHCGEWSVVPDESGVTVLAQHHVVLREKDIEEVLGAGATLSDARRRVHGELSYQSLQILRLAQQHAQSAVRVL